MAEITEKGPDDSNDQEARIAALRRRVAASSGGEWFDFESDELSPDDREAFWSRVVAAEETDWVTPFDQLLQAGMHVPAPETLDDAQLTVRLWEVIRGLARLRSFLYHTDHLSDRELYEVLWHDVLRESMPAMPIDDASAWHIDLTGSGGEEDNHDYLRYYADEDERRHWAEHWPDDVIPESAKPPYDRDRLLPSRR